MASGKCHQNILLYNDIIILITVEIFFEKKIQKQFEKSIYRTLKVFVLIIFQWFPLICYKIFIIMQIITSVEEACLNDMKIMHMQYKNIIFSNFFYNNSHYCEKMWEKKKRKVH